MITKDASNRQAPPSRLDSMGVCLLTAVLSVTGCDAPRAPAPAPGNLPTHTFTYTNQNGDSQQVTVLTPEAVNQVEQERDKKVIVVAVAKDAELERVQKFAHLIVIRERQVRATLNLEGVLEEIEKADRDQELGSSALRANLAAKLDRCTEEYEATCDVWFASDYATTSMRKDPNLRQLLETEKAADKFFIDQTHRLKNDLSGNADWITRDAEVQTHSTPGTLAAQLRAEFSDCLNGLREGIGNLTGAYGRSSEVVFGLTEDYKDEPWAFNQPEPPSRVFNGTRYYLFTVSPERLVDVIEETALDATSVPLPNFSQSRHYLRPLSETEVAALGRLGSDGERVVEVLAEEVIQEGAAMALEILFEVLTH